jgi:hypothetical protein
MNHRIFLVCLFTLISCAQPKYETAAAIESGKNQQSQKVSKCSTKFSISQYCVLWQWEKTPTADESGVLTLKVVRPNLLDDSAVPVDLDSDPTLFLWMPSMGHGSAPNPRVSRIDIGSYRITDVFLIMPGEWEMKFQIKEGNQVQDEAVALFIF